MKDKILLDSYAILAYLKGEDGAQKVKKLLSSNKPVIMNDINIGEIFYIIAKAHNLEKRLNTLSHMLIAL